MLIISNSRSSTIDLSRQNILREILPAGQGSPSICQISLGHELYVSGLIQAMLSIASPSKESLTAIWLTPQSALRQAERSQALSAGRSTAWCRLYPSDGLGRHPAENHTAVSLLTVGYSAAKFPILTHLFTSYNIALLQVPQVH